MRDAFVHLAPWGPALPFDLLWEHGFCGNGVIPFSGGFHPCVVLQGCMWAQRKDPHCVALPLSRGGGIFFKLFLFLILSSLCLEGRRQSRCGVTTVLLARPWLSLNKEPLFHSQDAGSFHRRPDSRPVKSITPFLTVAGTEFFPGRREGEGLAGDRSRVVGPGGTVQRFSCALEHEFSFSFRVFIPFPSFLEKLSSLEGNGTSCCRS